MSSYKSIVVSEEVEKIAIEEEALMRDSIADLQVRASLEQDLLLLGTHLFFVVVVDVRDILWSKSDAKDAQICKRDSCCCGWHTVTCGYPISAVVCAQWRASTRKLAIASGRTGPRVERDVPVSSFASSCTTRNKLRRRLSPRAHIAWVIWRGIFDFYSRSCITSLARVRGRNCKYVCVHPVIPGGIVSICVVSSDYSRHILC